MGRLPLVYHDGYDLNFGQHVFSAQKYRLIRKALVDEAFVQPGDFHAPEPATCGELALVHTPEWVEKLCSGKLAYHDILRLEAPYSRQMVEAFILAAGGTTLAARLALESGIAMNIGGGFHHAFAGHGEGFCAINDIAVAIRVLQREGRIRRAVVIDCDVHQGNGTASIFAGDPDVFTVSLHQANNYPAEKPPSSLDIDLPDGTTDREYLNILSSVTEAALSGFRPDLAIYAAGADPYFDDQLGGLDLTKEGLKARDSVVFAAARRARVPVAVVLAGGYAERLSDTVEIHANTARAAAENLG